MDNEAQGFNFSMDSNGLTMNGNFGSTNYAGYEYTYVAIAAESEGHPPFPPSSTTVTETPDPATATMVVNAESFDVGATASGPALTASITSLAGVEGTCWLQITRLVRGCRLVCQRFKTTYLLKCWWITFTSTNAGIARSQVLMQPSLPNLDVGPVFLTGPWTRRYLCGLRRPGKSGRCNTLVF